MYELRLELEELIDAEMDAGLGNGDWTTRALSKTTPSDLTGNVNPKVIKRIRAVVFTA